MKFSVARLALFAFTFLAWLPMTLPNAAGSGRAPLRCAQACQQVHAACSDRSDAICLSIYPGNEKDYFACLLTAKTQCGQVEQECRQGCMSYKETAPLEP